MHKQEPDNLEAKIAIRRLETPLKQYKASNQTMLKFFYEMKNDNEVKEFERWLMKI